MPARKASLLDGLMPVVVGSILTALVSGAITWGTIQGHMGETDRRLNAIETVVAAHATDTVNSRDFQRFQTEMKEAQKQADEDYVTKAEFNRFVGDMDKNLEDIKGMLRDLRRDPMIFQSRQPAK